MNMLALLSVLAIWMKYSDTTFDAICIFVHIYLHSSINKRGNTISSSFHPAYQHVFSSKQTNEDDNKNGALNSHILHILIVFSDHDFGLRTLKIWSTLDVRGHIHSMFSNRIGTDMLSDSYMLDGEFFKATKVST